MKVKKRFLVFLVLFVLSLVLASSVLAVSGKPKVTGKSVGVGGARVEGKLRACQAKENSIKKQMSQLEKMATNMLDNFNKIQGRVETYYTSKVIPGAKTISGAVQFLVDETQIKKETVETALTQAKNNAANFSCSGDDPKGKMTQFRDDMKLVKKALQDYRTSIRNLIVAVRRSDTGQTERNVTVSPKPTKTGVGGSKRL